MTTKVCLEEHHTVAYMTSLQGQAKVVLVEGMIRLRQRDCWGSHRPCVKRSYANTSGNMSARRSLLTLPKAFSTVVPRDACCDAPRFSYAERKYSTCKMGSGVGAIEGAVVACGDQPQIFLSRHRGSAIHLAMQRLKRLKDVA